ncbi:MAG: hypothetical protein QY323_06050 [Patescibacteria group bacterium]|nr:MAG: hypothetical protein QY323_06050 [Patescibacteria group bacterium]
MNFFHLDDDESPQVPAERVTLEGITVTRPIACYGLHVSIDTENDWACLAHVLITFDDEQDPDTLAVSLPDCLSPLLFKDWAIAVTFLLAEGVETLERAMGRHLSNGVRIDFEALGEEVRMTVTFDDGREQVARLPFEHFGGAFIEYDDTEDLLEEAACVDERTSVEKPMVKTAPPGNASEYDPS